MKKRLFAAAAALWLLCAAALAEDAAPVFTPLPAAASAATPAPAASAANRTVTIRRDGDVNVRREPNAYSQKVGMAKAGRTYALVETAENGWYRIRLLDGTEGYISPKLVQGEPQAATAQRAIMRKSANVNVRESPDPASRRVGVARAGRSYPLLDTADNGWYRVLLSGGVVGYVSPKMILRVTEPGENPDATPASAESAADTGETVRIRRSGNVNVRQEPAFASVKIGTAVAGRRYPLLETAENGWYKIRLENGVEGYISPKLTQ